MLIQYPRNRITLFFLLCQTLWHKVVRAAAAGGDCMMRLVGQIHRVAEGPWGRRDHNQTKHKLIAEHYGAGSAAEMFDV